MASGNPETNSRSLRNVMEKSAKLNDKNVVQPSQND
jgi:hypothetical protein